jgi:hypothetical protein
MDETKRKRLNGMLEAIKDIKRDNYVGTKEAFDTLKEMQKARELPEEVSKHINETLEETFSSYDITYSATPERVSGLIEILNKMEFDNMGLNEYIDNYEESYDYGDIGTGCDKKPDYIADRLKGFFIYSNLEGCTDDSDFGFKVSEYLIDRLLLAKENIPEELETSVNRYILKEIFKIMKDDWYENLSRQEMSRRESNDRRVIERFGLRNYNMVERLKRDRLDHRLEYRRQVLTKWLGERHIENYEQAIETADSSIQQRKERLEKCKSYSSPVVIINTQEKMLDEARFIRLVLGGDRKYVTECLNH